MQCRHWCRRIARNFACIVLVIIHEDNTHSTQDSPELILIVDIPHGSSCLGSIVADLPDVIIQNIIVTRLYPLLRKLVSVSVPQRSERFVMRVGRGGASTYRDKEGDV